MIEELNSIDKNDTWTLVPLPPWAKAITCIWVFWVKESQGNSEPRLKSCLVARGFQQKESMDYSDIFAPVVKWSTVRTISAIVGSSG